MLAILGLLVAACGGDDPGATTDRGSPTNGAQPEVLRVVVLPTSGIAPLYLGRDKGFFADRGIELELQVAAGGAEAVPAVVSGDVDFAYGASVSSAIARARGIPIKIVAQGIIGAAEEESSINKLVVRGSSEIREPRDLEGAKIAVNTLGSVAEIGIRATLEEFGVDLSKVDFVEIGLPDMPAALERGRVDAIWATEPFLSQVEGQGAQSLYAWDVELAPNASLASYFTSEQFIENSSDTVHRFVDAVNESLTYAQEHPDEVRQAILTYLEIPDKAVESMTLPQWGTDMRADTIERQADYAVKYGIIEEKPSMEELIYTPEGS